MTDEKKEHGAEVLALSDAVEEFHSMLPSKFADGLAFITIFHMIKQEEWTRFFHLVDSAISDEVKQQLIERWKVH